MAVPPPTEQPPDTQPADKPRADAPGNGDVLALGIGCLVILIFFAAVVLVGISRD